MTRHEIPVPDRWVTAGATWEYRAGYRAGRVHGSDAINPVTVHDDDEDADLVRADAWDAGCRAGRGERAA